ncbi:MAG: type II toxin-antitoxin system PemK/MazF family toxin [Bacillota bacterium]|nr:type II toxin-antitoxin system PemK/MazF family toxin [Bacillota bacterium]
MIHRGDIYFANLSGSVGSEQDGVRPVLIIQNDIGNKYSSTVIVACVTTKKKGNMPTHVDIEGCGLKHKSVILMEHIKTIDKMRLIGYTGTVNSEKMREIEQATKISLGMGECVA